MNKKLFLIIIAAMFLSIIPLTFGVANITGVAHYTFNASMLADSQGSNTLTNYGSGFVSTTGGRSSTNATNQTVNSAGTNSYLYVSGGTIPSGQVSVSVSGWVRLNNNGLAVDGADALFWFGNYQINTMLAVYYQNKTTYNQLCVGPWGGGNTDSCYTGLNLTLGTWKHIVVTFNTTDSVSNIYIDGTLVKTYDHGTARPNLINQFQIGGSCYTGCPTTGQMGGQNQSFDEVRIYTRVLTQEDVTALYDKDKDAVQNSFTFYNTNNVNATYTLNTTPTFTINATNASAWNITLYAAQIKSTLETGTGGVISTSGPYTIHTFTTNGTFVPPATITSVEALVVASGGSGGDTSGGGGAGGLIYNANYAVTNTSYPIIVGGTTFAPAANSGLQGNRGQNSSFGTMIANGGGGSSNFGASGDQRNGGSGAGSAPYMYGGATIGTATPAGQGNNGGNGDTFAAGLGIYRDGGGGGGAGGVGGAGTAGSGVGQGGVGGLGLSYNISGINVTYAAGGGGWGGTTGGNGGAACAGNGSSNQVPRGENASNNTGCGGGGGQAAARGGNGGSGIVIIRYLTPTTYGTYTPIALGTNSTYVSNSMLTVIPNISLTVGEEYQWWFTANSNATNYVNSSIYNIFIAGSYPTLGGFNIGEQCSVYSTSTGYYIQ